VGVHHVDRDRDDPLLKEVLAQRPWGVPGVGIVGGKDGEGDLAP
jgi:hypothetical protein